LYIPQKSNARRKISQKNRKLDIKGPKSALYSDRAQLAQWNELCTLLRKTKLQFVLSAKKQRKTQNFAKSEKSGLNRPKSALYNDWAQLAP
jgi:hypothetical protein